MSKRKLEDEDWSCDEQLQLLHNLKRQCPEKDKKSYATRSKAIDWQKVTLDGRTPEQCQVAWTKILSRVRKSRTLGEIVSAAKDCVIHPMKDKKRVKHPDEPVKPLTAYFQFLKDYRQKTKAKHPELTHQEMLKKLAEKWATLSQKKKNKYERCYKEKFIEYQEASAKFLELHPELKEPKKPKAPSPFNMYFKAKKDVLKEKHPEMSNTGILNKLKKKYAKLRPEKRKKWVTKALDAVPEYEKELQNYQLKHPGFKLPSKRMHLSMEDQELAGVSSWTKGKRGSKLPGAPTPPPRSAFNLFVSNNYQLIEGSGQEKLRLLSQQWKEIGPKKEKYTKKMAKMTKAYNKQVTQFMQTLTPEQLALYKKSLPKKTQKLLENLTSINGDVASETQETTTSNSNYEPVSKLKADSRKQTFDHEADGNSSSDFE